MSKNIAYHVILNIRCDQNLWRNCCWWPVKLQRGS